jgi:hypothetical protein
MSRSRKDSESQPVDNTAIFGLPAISYRASILKKILTIFKQRLKPRQTRKQILERVVKLSESLSKHDFQAVSGHLKRGVGITRKSIAEWPTFPPIDTTEDSKKINKNPMPQMRCELCYETNPDVTFRNGKLDPGCNHKDDLCDRCLQLYFGHMLRYQPWTGIHCPTCDVVISPFAMRPYLKGKVLAE